MAREASRMRGLIACASLFLTQVVLASGGIAIVGTELRDNGDDDGFADTYETVQLHLIIRNTTPYNLRDVVLSVATGAPEIACVSRPLARVGDLAAGETKRALDAFVFTMGDVDRAARGLGPLDLLSAVFDVTATANLLSEATRPTAVTLDLDLNATGGEGPTTFFEGFESGTLGAFEVQNLDAGRNSLAGSDGYRCQYHDPDWPASNSYGWATDCFLGASPAQVDATYWHNDGPDSATGATGRGYSGSRSLHYGIWLGTSLGYTTPMATLEAAGTTEAIGLDRGRVCEQVPATRCASDRDCLPGDRCVGVEPTLSFKHQVDLPDWRSLSPPGYRETADRAVVQAQLADESGRAAGDWIKLEPYLNIYDQRAYDNYYSNCTFDPVDDGNTEDDFFDPTDPDRRLGPSSTCFDEPVFGWMGDTFSPFDPGYLGLADGPGLEGESGPGTWVESRFSLGRFEGRRIRIRFLATSLKGGSIPNWSVISNYLNPGDDGWWIDDVEISGALTVPATVTADPAPNLGLPGHDDGDGDGAMDACDTCPAEPDPLHADRDGDGVGDSCDTCLELPDPDQLDTDGDGLGDACEACPSGDDDDSDGDALPCHLDNCPLVANANQADLEGDGVGDACDPCPTDSNNDNVDDDGDGAACGLDNCPTRYNPGSSTTLRLSGVLDDLGSGIVWSTIGPDSRTVIYVVGSEPAALPSRLYSVVPGELRPVKLAGTESPPSRIDSRYPPAFSPDGSWVVYKLGSRPAELYAVPARGGAAIRLNPPLVTYGSVRDFAISPDGSRVVYAADQEIYTQVELYSVPIAGGPSVKLSGPMVAGGSIVEFRLAPESSTVFYRADQDTLGLVELYAVPIAGGQPRKLNPPLIGQPEVYSFATSRDGSRAVFIAQRPTSPAYRLYGVDVSTAAVYPLDGDWWNAYSYRLSPDDRRVVFEGNGGVLFSVPIEGGSTTRLASDAFNAYFEISGDGTRVVFRDDQELYSVPITGGSVTKLNGALVPGGAVSSFHIDPQEPYVVYIADQDVNDRNELYSVPTTGGAATKLNAPLPAGGAVEEYPPPVFSHDGSQVLFMTTFSQDGRPSADLYLAPVGGGPVRRINDGWLSGTMAGSGYFSGDDSLVIHTASPAEWPNLWELLMATDLALDPDADGDGILRLCDTCPGVANPDSSDPDCDQDGSPTVEDNCPEVRNPDQANGDLPVPDAWGNACDVCPFVNDDQRDTEGDGAGDACDCAPADPATRPAAEVLELHAGKPLPSVVRVTWPQALGADAYAVTRARLSEIDADSFGDCLVPSEPQSAVDDAEIPLPGEGFAYLIQGIESDCGLGTLGPGADGTERINSDPDRCM